jgi:hypothetical protein
MIPSLLLTPDVSVTETEAEGSGLTVIVTEAVAWQPLVFVTVTVYVVVEAGDTVTDIVVAPVLQA